MYLSFIEYLSAFIGGLMILYFGIKLLKRKTPIKQKKRKLIFMFLLGSSITILATYEIIKLFLNNKYL